MMASRFGDRLLDALSSTRPRRLIEAYRGLDCGETSPRFMGSSSANTMRTAPDVVTGPGIF
jgi:hypothetical protein